MREEINRGKFVFVSLVLIFIISNSPPAYGEIVTIEVEGVAAGVETYNGMALDDSVTAGSIMTGSCTYDTETPDQSWPESIGLYSMISVSMSIGNYTFIHDPESSEDAYFYIDILGGSGYKVASPSSLFYGQCWINGEPHNLEDLDLSFPGINLMYLKARHNFIVSDALPDADSFSELSSFDDETTFFVGNGSGPMFIISGEITSITVIPEHIPEPGTVFLLGLGGLALLRNRKS